MTAGSVSLAQSGSAAEGRPLQKQEGVAIRVEAAHFTSASAHARPLTRQLTALAAEGWPTGLSVAGLAPDSRAPARLAEICEYIVAAFERAGLNAVALELTLDASVMPATTAWRIRRSILGQGVLNLVLSGPLPGRAWQALWQLRDEPVTPACWPFVTAATRLLATEHAQAVLPFSGLQAPPQSAWLRGELPMPGFVRPDATLDTVAVEGAIDRLLGAAPPDFDVARWPTARMRQDAWLNRRLALRLTRIGDAAQSLGIDPARRDHVVLLDGLVAGLRRIIIDRSRSLARRCETLPAIALADPCLRLPRGGMRGRWRAHWRAAVCRSALAHRNLLVMSPWSLFPASGPECRYVNLLPLLRHADACAFRGRPRLDEWSANKFSELHQRTWAISAAGVHASGVAERL